MKTFIEFVNEARRNPEQNPKISAYDALEPYKNDPNIYISFTKVDKIGLNPKSPYRTPWGIYTYPLKEIWEEFDHINRHISVPFAGDAPYIWVVKQTKGKFINDLYSDYTSVDFDRDMDKLAELYADKITNVDEASVRNYSELMAQRIINGMPISVQMISIAIKIANIIDGKPIEWEDFVDQLNAQFKDLDNWEMIEKEPYTGLNVSARLKITMKRYNEEFLGLQNIINDAAKYASHKNPAGSFWYVTRRLSAVLTSGDAYNPDAPLVSKGAIKWNTIFRELGYSGFADKRGEGIIHSSEPTQAVFTSVQAFKKIEKVLNVNPRKMVDTPRDVMNYIKTLAIKDNELTFAGEGMTSQLTPEMKSGDWITAKHFKTMIKQLRFKRFAMMPGDNQDRGLLFSHLLFKFYKKLDAKDAQNISTIFLKNTKGDPYMPSTYDVWFKEHKVSKKDQEKFMDWLTSW